jgi:hypothetical protein
MNLRSEVDVLACCLILERLFFISRVEVEDRRTVKLDSQPRRSQWTIYRENWGVFQLM